MPDVSLRMSVNYRFWFYIFLEYPNLMINFQIFLLERSSDLHPSSLSAAVFKP